MYRKRAFLNRHDMGTAFRLLENMNYHGRRSKLHVLLILASYIVFRLLSMIRGMVCLGAMRYFSNPLKQAGYLGNHDPQIYTADVFSLANHPDVANKY